MSVDTAAKWKDSFLERGIKSTKDLSFVFSCAKFNTCEVQR